MFQINWMPEAEREYYSNLEFWIIHNKSNSYSLKIISEVERMDDLLSQTPTIGKITNPELEVLKVMVLNKFYIYYKIIDNTVNILAFKAVDENHNKHSFGI